VEPFAKAHKRLAVSVKDWHAPPIRRGDRQGDGLARGGVASATPGAGDGGFVPRAPVLEWIMDFPVLKTQRLYQKISGLLIDTIRAGRFPPGQVLPAERDLAKQLGVSRSSVREALIALEISGWVEIRVGNGVFVRSSLPETTAPPSTDDVSAEDLLKARQVIEGELAALAATEATDAQLRALADLATRMAQKLTDDKTFHTLDMQFHVLIGEMTGNPLLTEVVEQLWAKHYSPTFLRLEQHYAHTDLAMVWDRDHQAIVSALMRREPGSARTAMRRHLKNVLERLFRQTR
jgi:DNA-binding FadR family transcriptional regulator